MKLKIQDLTKHYGTLKALDSMTCSFTPGVYGVLGPNGAGKSTLMGLMTDSLKREQGSILWEDRDILEWGKEYRKIFGYMPQNPGLYEEMTALQFLRYMADLKEIPRRQARVQVDSLLDILQMHGFARSRIRNCSGGMRQRVLLAQALLGDPKLLILDEPTAGLDPQERIRIRNYIASLAEQRIVILATHVVPDIESIAKEILLLDEGRLLAAASPQWLIAQIAGKVGEKRCSREEREALQLEYGLGQIYQRKEGQVLRLVSDNLPPCFSLLKESIGLEDVYLYYFHRKQEEVDPSVTRA